MKQDGFTKIATVAATLVLTPVIFTPIAFGQTPPAGTAQPEPAPASSADAAAASAPRTAPGTATSLADIVVTANKRAERQLDVAGGITALRADDLLEQGYTGFRDYAGLVPGLQVNSGEGSGVPVIRGLTQGFDPGSTTRVVVNGVPIGASTSFPASSFDSLDLDPLDIQRVEVLKGPQGTLYGANSLGGLISYTTRDPNLSRVESIVRGEVNGVEHGDAGGSVRGTLSAPIIENELGFRVSGYYESDGGYIDNDTRGVRNQNHDEKWGVHGDLMWRPTEDLTVRVEGFYQRTQQDARDTVIYDFATHAPRDGDLKYNDYLYPIYQKKVAVGLVGASYDLDFATISSTTSFQNISSDNEVNGTRGPLGVTLSEVLPLFGGVTYPTPPLTSLGNDTTIRKITEEVRLTSASDQPLTWVLGAFYTFEKSSFAGPVDARTTANGAPPGIDPLLDFRLVPTFREYSGFANATYRVLDDFDVTGGVRVGQLDQTSRQLFSGSDTRAYNTLLGLVGAPATPADSGEISEGRSVITYLATLRYHFSPDGMVFFRYATGFRPGGTNVLVPGLPQTFNPDRTDNYEVGVKGEFWDKRGSVDVTAYWLDWKDILTSVVSGGLQGYANGGDARSRGVEAALTLRPLDGLSLAATLAASDARILRVASLAAAAAGVNNPLPYNPKWSGSVSARYDRPLTDRWTAYGSAVARLTTSRYSSFESSKSFPNYVLPGYGILDLNAGLDDGQYTLDLFVRNVGDKRAQLGFNGIYGVAEVTIAQPRTFGAAVTARF